MKHQLFLQPVVSAAILTLAAFAARAEAETFRTADVAVTATVIAEGLAHPWAVEILPDGALLVTEREGRMRIVEDGAVSPPVAGVPDVWANGQGGLLDLALAPDFRQSNLVYFSFSEPGPGGAGTAVARARLERGEDNRARLSDVEVVWRMEKKTSAGQHFGSRLVFAPDGTLFITTGDRGAGDRAQDMRDSAGAVLRINPDGSVPADNPDPQGARWLPELWSKGHRNIQGAVWDPLTDALWTVEHGARGGDEINRPEPGKNYGWPVISYGRNYSGTRIGIGTAAPGYEQPLYYWDPSIAPSGLAVYEGGMFPEWQGDLLVGALRAQLVARLERQGGAEITGEERMFEGAFGRIRDIAIAPDGAILLATDEPDGRIIRLTRAD
jgi:glucose/arabinose dehydrogenase